MDQGKKRSQSLAGQVPDQVRPNAARIAIAIIISAMLCALQFQLPASAAGVAEIDGYKMRDYRSPVPETLRGAKVIDAADAGKLMQAGQSDVVFIDVYPKPPKPNLPKGTVWREPKHESIKGAVWLANVGFGVLSPQFDGYFQTNLQRLTGGDKAKRVVFFCLRDCWMSWNAAKRAIGYGYTNVIWFPDGTDGWKDFDLPIIKDLKPEPETE